MHIDRLTLSGQWPWFAFCSSPQCSSVLTEPNLLSLSRTEALATQPPHPLEAASGQQHTRGRIRRSCAVKHTHALPMCAFHSRNTLFLNHFYASLGTKPCKWLCAKGSVCIKLSTFLKFLYLRRSQMEHSSVIMME